jgi:hypothetical protein
MLHRKFSLDAQTAPEARIIALQERLNVQFDRFLALSRPDCRWRRSYRPTA